MFPPETHILVIDDMLSMRQLIKAELRNLGFLLICEADNGADGLELVHRMRAVGNPIELILSDWAMPKMDGFALLTAIRANPDTAKLPFIMITAEGEQTQVVKALKAGVSNFLMKPFSPASLSEKLQTTWRRLHATRRSA
jgi:two-component system, chemotaxis family, chemotaxis protein CheY